MFGRLTLSFSLTFYSNVVEIKSSQVDFCGENQSKKFSSSLFIFYFDFLLKFCGYQNLLSLTFVVDTKIFKFSSSLSIFFL